MILYSHTGKYDLLNPDRYKIQKNLDAIFLTEEELRSLYLYIQATINTLDKKRVEDLSDLTAQQLNPFLNE